MARTDERPCLACVRDDLRLTERFSVCDDAVTRITDLSAKGLKHYFCYRAQGSYFVCYRGILTRQGLLPRYEGQMIDGP